MAKVIAVRGGELELVVEDGVDAANPDAKGRIRNTRTDSLSNLLPIQQILKFGYWNPPKAKLTIVSGVVKGGPSSGWFSPPKGTHSGEKHRSVGSGKATKAKKPTKEPKKSMTTILPPKGDFPNGALLNEYGLEVDEVAANYYNIQSGVVVASDDPEAVVNDAYEDGSESLDALIKDYEDNIADLSNRTGLESEDVEKAIVNWGENSSDSAPSLLMQRAASDAFGAPWNSELDNNMERVVRLGDLSADGTPGEFFDGPKSWTSKDRSLFVRSMYDKTQADLASKFPNGTTHLRLYRGTAHPQIGSLRTGQSARYDMNPMSSWTASPIVAERFGSDVIMADIPIDRILSTASTGFGGFPEMEFVVLGSESPDVVTVVDVD